MSFFVSRTKEGPLRVHTLYYRTVEENDYPVAVGAGKSDMDAAIALDMEVQAIRGLGQLNLVRAREAEAAKQALDYGEEIEVIVPGKAN